MINELLFFLQITVVSAATICFARLGKSALVAYISLLFVIANIFVIKQIEIFSLYATTADAFIIGISFALNLIQEIWGKESARKAVWISFACSAFYVIMTQFLLHFVPVIEDVTHPHFVAIMTNTLRIITASFVSYIITQLVDTTLYAYLKRQMNNRYFVARNYFSICTSQLLDTVLFSVLGLYGIVTNLEQMIVVSYVIKLSAMIAITPWLVIAKQVVAK